MEPLVFFNIIIYFHIGLNKMKLRNVYFHTPFCLRKCLYCDFAVTAVGKQQQNEPLIDKYVHYVGKEVNWFKGAHSDRITPLETIYFGGGTPSLLTVSQLSTILAMFTTADNAEISVELDPGTFDLSKLH